MRSDSPLLVLDTASPLVSLALGTAGDLLAVRTMELRSTSERLLLSIDEVLSEAGLKLTDLGGVAALRGPGSFTGLRIGLATVLGWHQALELPATAIDTLDVLAATPLASAGSASGPVLAVVDALRGDWYRRRYTSGKPRGEAALVTSAELLEEASTGARCRVVGFGVSRLGGAEEEGTEVELIEPPPLAPVALGIAARAPSDPARLTDPIYFRPPAVTLPGRGRKA